MSEHRENIEPSEIQEIDHSDNHQEVKKNNDASLLRFKTRYAKPYDIPFIKKTWLYSLFNSSPYRFMNKREFMSSYSKVIDYILTNPETLVRVAHLPDDEDIIISYSVMQHKEYNILHFVYTKKMWRGQEVHNLIIPEYSYYTHITNQWIATKPTKPFNPFLIGK